MAAAYLAASVVPRHGSEQFWCVGKEAFRSPAIAHMVAVRRRHVVREQYRCDACGLWHIGRARPVASTKGRSYG